MKICNDAARGHPVVIIKDPLPDHVLGLQGLKIDIIDEICGVIKQNEVFSFNLSVWMV